VPASSRASPSVALREAGGAIVLARLKPRQPQAGQSFLRFTAIYAFGVLILKLWVTTGNTRYG